MSDVSQVFRQRLEAVLGRKGISERKLAEMAGISNATLSRQKSRNSVPSVETVAKIADALHVNPAYLLGWRE